MINLKIKLINGPNLNLLGLREKKIYGNKNFDDIVNELVSFSEERGHQMISFQSNIEGEIINEIHRAYFDNYDAIIINPGAYTHYSIAIYDALKGIPIKAVEVHLSNIHQREEFRHKSVTAPACIGQVCGFGEFGYKMAVFALENDINKETNN